MLWLDKHRPEKLDQLTVHDEISQQLSGLADSAQFPHLLLYGPAGAGKRTRVMALLQQMYGKSVTKLKVDHREFKKAGTSTSVELTLLSSNHHIELNPSDAGRQDTLIVQTVIKEIAQSQSINHADSERPFKVVVINEVDNLSHDAQAALRRTMEKYTGSCRLILTCNSICRVIDPVRSRCLGLRVPAPPVAAVAGVLQRVAKLERVTLPAELATKMAVTSERNMRRALLMLEATHVMAGVGSGRGGGGLLTATTEVSEADWQQYIATLASGVLQTQSPQALLEARKMLYQLLGSCIPPEIVLKHLTIKLLEKTDNSLKPEVIKWAAYYEHRLHLGQKPIFHLEAFVAKFMSIYKRFMIEMTAM